MSISNEQRIVAKAVIDAFGGTPKVFKYWDDRNEASIDILSCADKPYDGITSFSTLGLAEHSIGYTVEDVPLRIEIVGACDHAQDCFSNIIASCAFYIINDKYTCYPGAMFRNIVELYKSDSPLKHILFAAPFLWDDKLKTLQLPNMKVTWLLAVPISDAEFEFAKKNGSDALESLFEEKQIDMFDLMRKSVV
jgi:hypothetical protein